MSVFLCLLLTGVGLYVWLERGAASPTKLQEAVERFLAQNPAFGRSRYCLTNLAYGKNPLYVARLDRLTRQWVGALVSAGLYTAPQGAADDDRKLLAAQIAYTKTEAGEKATASGALCLAAGFVVSGVDAIQEHPDDPHTTVQARVRLALKEPHALINDPYAVSALTGQGRDYVTTLRFAARDGVPEVIAADDLRNEPSRAESSATAHAYTSGLIDRIKDMFMTAGNPILGRWRATFMGIEIGTLEFLTDETRTNGVGQKVRYEHLGEEVIVRATNERASLRIRILDTNTIRFIEDGGEILAHRIE